MGLPPCQRVDHTPVVVLQSDDAWNTDLINYELAVIAGERVAETERPVTFPSRDDHPYIRYVSGLSRSDIRTVERYIRLDAPQGPALRFTMRRLTLRQCELVDDHYGQNASRNLALRLALVSVHGAEMKLDRNGDGGKLSDADMARLRSLVGDSGLAELGTHAIANSRELLEAEKKP